ncbi:hypothetical protein KIP29_gp43 [Mycobacterium phage BabyRay]|uniref:Uncharacterized protein n=1 Tax=Mycobacterium phage BabyRay TaxID=1897486 RepID=A0A1D8EW25_9CAUD|nr:hypothetical protein KIP29_gp43 [Mycobacterium phage BabyRay]AOT25414.1 hypothetical protein SEA_BABYRAY_57 [Mycobacterium phage BabyRay]
MTTPAVEYDDLGRYLDIHDYVYEGDDDE